MVSPEVLAACRRGDPRAFEEVVRRTHRQVYTQALRLVRDRLDAEDVTQEAYLRVFRGLPGFRGDARFETWLYRIVTNTSFSYLRRRGRFGDLLADPEEAPLASTLRRSNDPEDDGPDVAEALDALPTSMRTVVLLKDVYGLSCQEIGEELGVSEGAVKVRLHRARRRLKGMLFSPGGSDEV